MVVLILTKAGACLYQLAFVAKKLAQSHAVDIPRERGQEHPSLVATPARVS